MSVSPLITTLFHMVVVYHYAFTFWFYTTDSEPRLLAVRPYTFGGSYKFLTILCLILQLFYFFWCCITDLISASAGRSSIGRNAVKFRDWLLAAAVFPVGTLVVIIFWGIYSVDRELIHGKELDKIMPSWLNHALLVVIIFWSIYAVDRELIFPEKLDKFFPSWLNHALHTFVLPLLLVEMFLVKHKYPSRTSGMLGTVVFGLAYLIWILYLGFAKDIWVYPFLQVLEGPYFVIFFTASSLFLLMIYIIGEKLNGLLAGKGKETSAQKID